MDLRTSTQYSSGIDPYPRMPEQTEKFVDIETKLNSPRLFDYPFVYQGSQHPPVVIESSDFSEFYTQDPLDANVCPRYKNIEILKEKEKTFKARTFRFLMGCLANILPGNNSRLYHFLSNQYAQCLLPWQGSMNEEYVHEDDNFQNKADKGA